MKALSFCRIGISLMATGVALYSYLAEQNRVRELSIEVPAKARELSALEEEGARLSYQIEQFESPLHLLGLAKRPEYSHLKPAIEGEIVELAAHTLPTKEVTAPEIRHRPLFILGAQQ